MILILDKQEPNEKKKKSSIINTIFRKRKGKKTHHRHIRGRQNQQVKVKSTTQGSTGGKNKGKEVRWRRDLERACLTGFWEGKCGTKREVQRIEVIAEEKGGTGMWNETQSLAGK